MAHRGLPKKIKPPRLCAEFAEVGTCEWGEHCRFSHGESVQTAPEDVHAFMEILTLAPNMISNGKAEQLIENNSTGEETRECDGRLLELQNSNKKEAVQSLINEKEIWHPGRRTRMAVPRPDKAKLPQVQGLDPIAAFYASYPSFNYNASKGPCEEFYRLSDICAWGRFSVEQKNARSAFQTALVDLFNERYGTDAKSVRNWQKICMVLNLIPLPKTIIECQEMVTPLHFNLVDMVGSLDQEIQLFPNRHKMHDYTTLSRKYFPSNHPFAGDLLKSLLKEL